MPDGRRQGLRRTLVAAAQSALDLLADGVDRLADGVEAIAGGLRSVGSGRAPARGRRAAPAPSDPRLAGLDPALAAYVAAGDPAWFSFDVPGSPPAALPEAPAPEWDETSARAPDEASTPVQTVRVSRAAVAASPHAPSRPRASSAAEEPGEGLPSQRIGFRPRRDRSDAAPSAPRSPAHPFGVPAWRRAAPPADGGTATPDDSAPRDGTASAPQRSPVVPDAQIAGHPSPQRAQAPSRSADAGLGAPPRTGPTAAARADAVPPWSAPAAASSSARSAVSDAARRPSRESPSASSAVPRLPFPLAPVRHPSASPVRENLPLSARTSPPAPRSRFTTSAPAVPSPWPELPPGRSSAPDADAGGVRAGVGASSSDVLVDEQRST